MHGIMPPSLDTIIATASRFDDGVFDLLNNLVQKPTSTDPNDDDISQLALATGVSEDELRYFLSFLTFLYVQTSDVAEENLEAVLTDFLEEHHGIEDTARLAGKLKLLLAHRDVQKNAAKKARLSEGLLPNITGLANFVDVRNDFERDADGNLTGELGTPISVVQLGIRTNSSKDHEKEIVLQLDSSTLDQLQKCLDEIRFKIKILGNA